MNIKKILSFILSISVLASTVINFGAITSSAETAEEVTASSAVIVNNYDEENVVYTQSGTSGAAYGNYTAYTTRTVNGEAVIERFANWNTQIKDYTNSDNTVTKAAFFGASYNSKVYTSSNQAGWTGIWNNTLTIYDSGDENLAHFVPKPNTVYTFKMKYRVDSVTEGYNLGFSLIYSSNADGSNDKYTEDNLVAENVAYFNAATNGWQTAQYTFTTGYTVKPLLLMLYTDIEGWHCESVEAWVDDIEIHEIRQNNVKTTNTYDETNVTYSYRNELYINAEPEGDSNAATDRLVNGTVENVDFARNGIYVEKYPETDNYAAHFGAADNYAKYTTGYWSWQRINTLRIYDSGSKNLTWFTPEPNTTYVFKMDYRVDAAPDRTMGFKLVYENDSVGRPFYTYTDDNLIKNDLVAFSAATDGWQTAEYTFTTGDTVKPLLLMLYTNNIGWHAINVDVWVDNIEITECGLKDTYMDFNTAQTEWNNSNRLCYESSGTVADSAYSDYGNAFKLLGVLSYRDTNNPDSEWYSGHPTAFTLMNGGATEALYYKAGESLNISFKLKTDAVFDGMGKDEFYVSLISMDSTNTHLSGYIRDYISQGRVVNVATVPNAVTEDWVEYSATVTVGHDGYLGMMFYSYGARAYGVSYIDNVTVSKAEEADNTVIDFSAEQTEYISTHRPSTTGVPTDSGDSEIGNVFQVNYLIADHDDVNPGNVWFEAYPAGFYFVNNKGNDNLFYKKGEVLNISFKVKKNVTMDQTYSDDFYVCAAFLETKTTAFNYVEEQLLDTGIMVRIATIDKNESDWVTYNGTITVPCDGYGSMVFYTTNKRTQDCKLWVDDVTIERYETASYERNGDINSDKGVNVLDIVGMKKMLAGVNAYNTAADMDYDGKYSASDITKLKKRVLGIDNSSLYMLGDVENLSKINMQGRWDANDLGVTLDWSASALEFTASCKGKVGVVLNTDIYWENPENVLYYAVYVDGERVSDKIAVGNGVSYVELADNLPEGEHSFSLVRLTDAYYGNTDAIAIELDGTLNGNADNKQMIEFIGDSITVGAGNLGDSTVGSDLGSNPSYQDASKSYAYLTAKAAGSDYSISARSGIALYYGYGHADDETVPCQNFTDFYTVQNHYRDSEAIYSSKRDSDIICINLGTNDYWSGTCPDDASFTAKLVSFVQLVKKYSPNAKVVLISGGINNTSAAAVSAAATELGGAESGYYYCALSYGLKSGANNHPGVTEHEQMANELTEFLKTNELI